MDQLTEIHQLQETSLISNSEVYSTDSNEDGLVEQLIKQGIDVGSLTEEELEDYHLMIGEANG